MNELSAAVVAVDITPDLARHDLRLHGYGQRGRKTAEGIHDPLYAKVLVLQQADTRLALITIDNLQVDGLFLEEIVAAADVPGLDIGTVAVCASHTHSAPAALQKSSGVLSEKISFYHEGYFNDCVRDIAAGLKTAAANLQPAVYGAETVRVGALVRNRRVPSYDYDTRGFSGPIEPEMPVDDEMLVLQLRGLDDGVLGTFVNLAAHGTVLGSDNMLVSADWAGYMMRAVEETLGGTCLYANGAEGNLAPDCGDGFLSFDEARTFGDAIAEKVREACRAMTFCTPGLLSVISKQVTLPEYQIAETSPLIAREKPLDPAFVQEYVSAIYPRSFQQTMIRIDDVALLTIPGEMFTELSLDFKKRARDEGVGKPCILGLANGSIGYMLPRDEYDKPGYETGMCLYGPDLGDFLIREGLQILAPPG